VSLALAVSLFATSSLALAMLLLPLIRRRHRAASRDAYNLAVYRDQLAEVERDLGRGLLDAEQAEAARAEIGRRILALTLEEGETGAGSNAFVAAALAILLLPVAAGALYLRLGSPALPDQPFASRGTERSAAPISVAGNAGQIDMNEAVARLAAHLKTHPEDLAGWLLLARSELSLGRYADAAEAYRQAADLSGHRADISGDWGEALVLAAGGTVTPAARAAFEVGLADPENAPRARYYLALGQLQQGDVQGALAGWRALTAAAPADAEWLPLVRRRIVEAEAALGAAPTATAAPSDAAVAAAAKAAEGTSPEQRLTMINAMVERLAARLETQPDDVDGWVRLGRSYMVLNQPDKAREAYARAIKLKPGDPALVQALAEAGNAAADKTGAPPPALQPSR
jgi:cytochrome c-type biogenesis protein CcmH